jgi:hypothetical protein
MDDPNAIAARYGMVAHKIVNDAAKVVDGAFGKINKVNDQNQPDDQGPFTAGDAIVTLSRLLTIAATGAIGFARIPLHVQTEKGPLLLADHIATVAAIALSDAEQVTEDLAKSLDENKFPQNQKAQLVETAVKLTSIGMIRGAEVLETVVAGPGRYRDPVFTSDPIPVDPKDHDRELRVVKIGRQAVPGENIAKLVEVVPKDRILIKDADTFQLRVNAAGIPSGVFVGVVQPCKPGTHTKDGDPVSVSLAL